MKTSVFRKMKHLAAKLCPRCSLTLQSNFYTHAPPNKVHRGDDGAAAAMKPAKCVLKTWWWARAHNCVTCRVTLLSNPPPPQEVFLFHRGCWQTMLYIWTPRLDCNLAGLQIWVFRWEGLKGKRRAIPPFIDPAILSFAPPPTHTQSTWTVTK